MNYLNKKILMASVAIGFCAGASLTLTSEVSAVVSAAPKAIGTPHPWVLQIVGEITKFGQSEACADGRALRKNSNNCATKDGAAIAIIVCQTHDNVYRDAFRKGQCGTKAAKTWGGVEDVGAYFERAIDQGKPDAIALACTPPISQLQGKLREVAQKKCGSGTTAPTRPTSQAPEVPKQTAQKIVKQEVAYMEELRKVLQAGPNLKPVRGRLNSRATNATVEGTQVSVPAISIPEVKSDADRTTLLQVAQDLSNALKEMNKAIDAGETVTQDDINALTNLSTTITTATTTQEVVQDLKQVESKVHTYTTASEKKRQDEERRKNIKSLFDD